MAEEISAMFDRVHTPLILTIWAFVMGDSSCSTFLGELHCCFLSPLSGNKALNGMQ